jgi:hypothetical protein
LRNTRGWLKARKSYITWPLFISDQVCTMDKLKDGRRKLGSWSTDQQLEICRRYKMKMCSVKLEKKGRNAK